jgi:hypothetical protein
MPSIAIISKPQKPELATILPELRVWLKHTLVQRTWFLAT